MLSNVEQTKWAVINSMLRFDVNGSRPVHSEKDFLPEGWDISSIGDLGVVVTGSTPPTVHAEYYGGEFMFVAPADISDSKWVRQSEKHLSALGRQVSREIPPKSIMVVCIGSTIGKIALAFESCTTNQQINSALVHERLDKAGVTV